MRTRTIRRKRNVGISITDTVNTNISVGSYTPNIFVMDIWKGVVRAIVAQTDTQNPANGLDEQVAAKERKSATSPMILVLSRIKR